LIQKEAKERVFDNSQTAINVIGVSSDAVDMKGRIGEKRENTINEYYPISPLPISFKEYQIEDNG